MGVDIIFAFNWRC